MKFKWLGPMIVLGLASGGVSASPCGGSGGAVDNYESAVSSGSYSSASFYLSNHPECFAGSATTSGVQINGTSFAQSSAISRALGLRFDSDNPGPRAALALKGMAAGNAGKKWNIWGNVENNDIRQSYRAANTFNTSNDSDVMNTVFGADYSLSPTTVLGVSLAVDRGDMSGFNAAPGNGVNNADTRGYSVAPYIGMQLGKGLIFDASAGVGKGKFTTNTATEAKSDRWFGAANLGYEHWIGNFQLSGKASYLRGIEDYDNIKLAGFATVGTAAKNTLGQMRLMAQAGYWMNGVMPYASLTYVNDVERKTTQFGAPSNPIGRDAWVWSLGVNLISLSNGLTGGIAYKQEEGRSNQRAKNLMANIGIRF